MQQTEARRGIYYGWWIVAASLGIMTVGAGGAGYVFGVFFQPLVNEFGWNRAQISLASTVMFIIMGLMGPIAGRITDRYGPRLVMVVGSIIALTATFLLSRTGSLIELYM